MAFQKIEQNAVISSWKDAISSGVFRDQLSKHIRMPQFGCFKDVRSRKVENEAITLNKIWSIGGRTGWYSFNGLWKIRGYVDKLFGGVGLLVGGMSVDNDSGNIKSSGDPTSGDPKFGALIGHSSNDE